MLPGFTTVFVIIDSFLHKVPDAKWRCKSDFEDGCNPGFPASHNVWDSCWTLSTLFQQLLFLKKAMTRPPAHCRGRCNLRLWTNFSMPLKLKKVKAWVGRCIWTIPSHGINGSWFNSKTKKKKSVVNQQCWDMGLNHIRAPVGELSARYIF